MVAAPRQRRRGEKGGLHRVERGAWQSCAGHRRRALREERSDFNVWLPWTASRVLALPATAVSFRRKGSLQQHVGV